MGKKYDLYIECLEIDLTEKEVDSLYQTLTVFLKKICDKGRVKVSPSDGVYINNVTHTYNSDAEK